MPNYTLEEMLSIINQTTRQTNMNLLHPEILPSAEDASRNFVWRQDKGALEARFVRREPQYFIVYLSSQTGCAHSCRFCWLTSTGQTMEANAEMPEFVHQAKTVLEYYDTLKQPALRVNFNFMARGEALANSWLLDNYAEAQEAIGQLALDRGLAMSFNLSTIMPKILEAQPKALLNLHGIHPTVIYYSLYSLDATFRKRWIPKALDPSTALERLAEWQDKTHGELVLHFAFIKGANDTDENVQSIIDKCLSLGLKPRFNAVRYNPHDSRQGEETDPANIERFVLMMQNSFQTPKSKIVSRVGHDVFASCGMFVD